MNYTNCNSPVKNAYRRFPISNNSWFDGFLKNEGFHVPSVNIVENKENFELEFSVPGYAKEDFVVQIKDDVLTVSAKQEVENNTEEKNFTRREFSKRSFSRSFTLSENVDQNSVHAKYENGILHLNLAKIEKVKEENTREIKIA